VALRNVYDARFPAGTSITEKLNISTVRNMRMIAQSAPFTEIKRVLECNHGQYIEHLFTKSVGGGFC
jgi:hypothetical protein